MSYKVLIVDDEKWIYDLLLRIVDWKAFGFEITGYVSNGSDAFEYICKHKPDLVISDIRIPEINGIELVKLVRSKDIKVRFVLISGYQQFEYAQDALKYNVEDYLLKPIEEEEIEAILLKISSELRNEDNYQKKIKNIMLRLDDSIKQLRVKIFESLLYSDLPVDVKYNEINKDCEMNFLPGFFQVLLLSLDTKIDVNKSVRGLFYSKIEKILNSYLHPAITECFILQQHNFLLVIMNFEKKDNIPEYYKSIFNKISQLVNAYNRMTITIAIGEPVEHIKNINHSFFTAKELMYTRAVYSGNRIMETIKFSYSPVYAEEILTSELKASLSNTFELQDFEKAEVLLESIFQHIDSIKNINPGTVFTILNQIENCLTKVSERSVVKEYDRPFGSYSLENEFLRCVGRKVLFKNFLSYIRQTLTLLSKQQKSKLSKPVEKAKHYIKGYYSKQLTLSIIANHVFLSEQYLSETFKKETGKTISNYIRDYRIDMAKIFMGESKYRITDIAEKVGYRDARHFSKVFKKVVGVTPKEYRQLGL